MKKSGDSDITFTQFIFIIHGCQVGTGMFSLPNVLAEKAGTDGWISLLFAWGINVIAGMIIVAVFKRYPNDTLADLLVRLFGKFIGKVLIIPFIFYLTFFAWTILSATMLFIKQWFLPLTPDYIVMILLTIPGYFIIGKSLRVLGRYCELVFYMIIWMFFFLVFPLKDSHWIHLLPIIKEGWIPILKGVPSAGYSSLGFEVIFFLYPFLQKKHLAFRGIVIANTLTFAIYLEVTLICFAFFSPDGITSYNQPLFNLLKSIEFHFLERFDMIFLALYLFVVSTTWLPYMFGVILSTNHLFGKKISSLTGVVFLLLMVVLISILHPSWNQSNDWIDFISRVGIWIAYMLPLFLYIYIRLFKRFERSETL